MNPRALFLATLFSVSLSGQNPIKADTPYQIRYSSNLDVGDSVINITNTGASSTTSFPAQDGNLCANVFTFSPDEQLVSCCSCPVTPDGLLSLSARNDLISNTLTPGVPTSIVVKLIASSGTTGTGGATVCDPSTVVPAGPIIILQGVPGEPALAAAGTRPSGLKPEIIAGPLNALAPGLSAWGTTLHALPPTPGSPATTYGLTETAFIPATLAPAELSRVTTLCGFIQSNGSGFGICKSCRLGGLGAVRHTR